jgi:hypothetical protein
VDYQIIFGLKWLLLSEALAHAAMSWGIFDTVRNYIAERSLFLNRLTTCFECLSVWSSTIVFFYLVFVDFWPITFIIIIARLASFIHIGILLLDAWRAATTNKI